MNSLLPVGADGLVPVLLKKRFPVTLLSAALAASLVMKAACSEAAEPVYVIESVDSTGVKTYAAMPLEKYQEMKASAALRNRCMPGALEAAKKEWNATYKGISKAFPRDVAIVESVTSLGLFTSEEAAREKLSEINARREQRRVLEADKLSSAEKQIKMVKDRIDYLRAAPSYSITGRTIKIRANRLVLKMLEHDMAEDKKRQTREEAARREARAIFERKLTALLSEAAG
jgi:hypothetical protein